MLGEELVERPPDEDRKIGEWMGFFSAPIIRNEDREITCVCCGYNGCEYAIEVLGNGRRIWAGIHVQAGCFDRNRRRVESERERRKRS